MRRRKVKSSNIASIGFDAKTRTLEVEFKQGRIWQYSKVSPAVHQKLISADSIGSHFYYEIRENRRIKGVDVTQYPDAKEQERKLAASLKASLRKVKKP